MKMNIATDENLSQELSMKIKDIIDFDTTKWSLSTIGNLFWIQQGKSVSKKNREGNSQHPFLRTANVFWGYIDLSTLDKMNFTEEEAVKLQLKKGDLLVCEGGEIGRSAVWNEEIIDCFYQNHLHRLRSKADDIYPDFYMYWMEAAFLLLGVYSGQGNKTTIPNLSQSRLSSFVVPLPPIDEQHAIANALRIVQEARDARQSELTLERERKAALMQHFFTHGTRGEPCKQTEIGEIPESWNVVELGKIADIVYGVQAAVAHLLDKSVGIPILTNINITNDGILDLSTLRYYKLPNQKREKLLLKKGDLLFNWRSGSQYHVGKTALFELDGEYTFSSFILRFRVTETVDNIFLLYYLYNIKARGFFAQNRQQSSVNSVFNASVAATIPVTIPTLPEQRTIASVLRACDVKIAALEQEMAILDELFQAMLEELMTGQLSAVPLIDESKKL